MNGLRPDSLAPPRCRHAVRGRRARARTERGSTAAAEARAAARDSAASGAWQEPDLAPQITIRRTEENTIEEARVNGQLKWIKVTPRHGRPYFLIPDAGGTRYIRRDSLDYGLKVPMWLLFEF
jgi:hypothetical protein